MTSRYTAQIKRIEAIVGSNDNSTFEDSITRYFSVLSEALQLPCVVTGIEDFQWEEYYILGPGNLNEYRTRKRSQPSFQDTFQLHAIEAGHYSEWMMFPGEDIAGHVCRIADSRKFTLGLSELKTQGTNSPNHQLLDDYSVFFYNYR
ncbi:MAG: hypothetical protein O7C75_05215 [Verrucomicrobia bacterium]|nr:hypothetical protein [Verrucomicrobiota bacterium]